MLLSHFGDFDCDATAAQFVKYNKFTIVKITMYIFTIAIFIFLQQIFFTIVKIIVKKKKIVKKPL